MAQFFLHHLRFYTIIINSPWTPINRQKQSPPQHPPPRFPSPPHKLILTPRHTIFVPNLYHIYPSFLNITTYTWTPDSHSFFIINKKPYSPRGPTSAPPFLSSFYTYHHSSPSITSYCSNIFTTQNIKTKRKAAGESSLEWWWFGSRLPGGGFRGVRITRLRWPVRWWWVARVMVHTPHIILFLIPMSHFVYPSCLLCAPPHTITCLFLDLFVVLLCTPHLLYTPPTNCSLHHSLFLFIFFFSK